ncbi:ATP-binding cassette domain-containing protein [Mangrovibrevibacter kandeliae]|uniref:ATP-binding cassette domain-containing protein n=1 Tax=Mangrovibrevibacter kandeliae TaxID=2968473 RepID=UPI0021178543|nr:ATP-binding cassette domain-containing protein [Aurantimonas sp. CSK15Z-1]MCQ8783766.1 ATP-binding cassette domain-containing protein [Aurantimonas sp. CSK15Z-1]
MAAPAQSIAPRGFAGRRHVPALVVMTLALNVLGLSIPLAAAQIFGRILPNPQSTTLPVMVVGVVLLAAAEGLLRYGRTLAIARAGNNFAALLTHRVLSHVVVSQPRERQLANSRSVEYVGAVQQLKERYDGQIVVSVVELLFLPLIVGVIFAVSALAGLFVTLCLVGFALLTLRDARRMNRLVEQITAESDRRYDFLFATLSGMQAIKAMGVEDSIARRYEVFQGQLATLNHALAQVSGRLINASTLASQAMIALMLGFGAVAVAQGNTTMGGVTALVLLAGRVMGPLQRAVFVFVQLRDVRAAEKKLRDVLAQPLVSTPRPDLDVRNEGRVELDDVRFDDESEGVPIAGVNLSLHPGEIVSISGSSGPARSALLQVMAGIARPQGGSVSLNGHAPTDYPQPLLNRCVGYVPENGVLFRGTIGENVTRFGEVSVEEAMDVAEILEIDTLINALPAGLDTKVTGGAGESFPPGLRQQLAILRALATRPKLILLDNADRGLDRDGYAKLCRFIGKVQGQAAFVIVSDDANLQGYATRRYRLEADGLHLVADFEAQMRTSYLDLRL